MSLTYRVETEDGTVIGMLFERKINRGAAGWEVLGWIFSPWVSNHRRTLIPRETADLAVPRWVKKMPYKLVEIT